MKSLKSLHCRKPQDLITWLYLSKANSSTVISSQTRLVMQFAIFKFRIRLLHVCMKMVSRLKMNNCKIKISILWSDEFPQKTIDIIEILYKNIDWFLLKYIDVIMNNFSNRGFIFALRKASHIKIGRNDCEVLLSE